MNQINIAQLSLPVDLQPPLFFNVKILNAGNSERRMQPRMGEGGSSLLHRHSELVTQRFLPHERLLK